VQWPVLLLSLLWSPFTLDLSLLSYRFDHSRARKKGEEDAAMDTVHQFVIEKVDLDRGMVQSADSKTTEAAAKVHTGILVPARVDTAFAKPYYYSALAGWAGLVLLLLALSPRVFDIRGFEVLAFYLAWVSQSGMLVGVLVTALVRGELGLLWRYSEIWERPKPGTPVAPLPSDTGKQLVLPVHM